MIIRNFDELSTTRLRAAALEIIEEGIKSIQPEQALKEKINLQGETVIINNKKFNLNNFSQIYIVGIGKAALESAKFLEQTLGSKITDGAIIDTQKEPLEYIRSFLGTHPLPSAVNVQATMQLVNILKKAKKDDLVIVIVSGGGSALLCQPYQLTVPALQKVFDQLLKSGADITQMNTLRKHLSKVHGGNLAKLAYPATVIGLIFSDIPEEDLSFVASGPTFLDKTIAEDARKIIEKYGLTKLPLIETPKEDRYFQKVHNFAVVSNKIALAAMASRAQGLGYKAKIISSDFQGEACTVGREILTHLKRGKNAILIGGETTVRVRGRGKGGRNQELVLGALPFLKEKQLIASVASDGKDNIQEAAGALADEQTLVKMEELGLDTEEYLKNNDSYNFFSQVGDVIVTGPTGGNVSDLMLAIQG